MPSLLAAFRREEQQTRDAHFGRGLRSVLGQSHDDSKPHKHRTVPTREIFGGVHDSIFAAPEAGLEN